MSYTLLPLGQSEVYVAASDDEQKSWEMYRPPVGQHNQMTLALIFTPTNTNTDLVVVFYALGNRFQPLPRDCVKKFNVETCEFSPAWDTVAP